MESTGSAATDEHVLWNVVEKWWIPVPPSHISSSTAEVLIFITDMGEPWNHDAMSKNFLMIDFQLLGEQNDDGCETIGKRNPLETTLFHGEFHVSMCNWFHFLIWRWLNSNCWWPESWMCWTPVGAPSRLTREDGLSGPLMDGATPTHLQRDHDQRPMKTMKIGENRRKHDISNAKQCHCEISRFRMHMHWQMNDLFGRVFGIPRCLRQDLPCCRTWWLTRFVPRLCPVFSRPGRPQVSYG